MLSLADTDQDGDADRVSRFLRDLNAPRPCFSQAICMWQMDKVTRYKYTSSDDGSEISATEPDVVIPASIGWRPPPRTIVFGGWKNVRSVGSSRIFEEDGPRRAAVLRANDDGRTFGSLPKVLEFRWTGIASNHQ
jgi:hypothetical protein